MGKLQLFVAGALLLFSGGVSAEIVDGVRQKPVPAKTQLQYEDTLYLYNVGAQKFFVGANDYNTRASVADNGFKVLFYKHLDESGEWDGKTVIFKDVVESKSNNLLMVWFATGDAGDVWVDHNGQPDTLWTITPQADEVYRLSFGEGNPNMNPETYPGVYFGVDLARDGGSNTRCFSLLDPSVTTNVVDWYFVAMDEYTAYRTNLEVYNLAQTLKTHIDAAKAKGLDVSAQEAVYLNEAASQEEIEAATAAVLQAIAKADENSASADNPIDKTADVITNASYDENSNTGWSGTAPAFQSYTNAEFYDKTYNYYQEKGNVPNGVYAVSLQAFYRAGSTSESYTNYVNKTNGLAKLFAQSGEDSLTVSIVNAFEGATTEQIGVGAEVTAGDPALYIPNNMEAAAGYFAAGRYAGNTLFFPVENGKLKIGLVKDSKIGADWTIFDNWNLKYYGNGADAYQLWLDQVIADAPDFNGLPEGTLMTEGMLDAYNEALAAVSKGSNKAEVLAAIETIESESEKLQANIDAWKTYSEALAKGNETASNPDLQGPDMDNLADYCEFDAEDIMDALSLTTEEVLAEVDKLNVLIDNAIKNCVAPGQDVTDMYIVNANYEDGANGWEGGPTVNGPANNKCAEKFNSAFDVYQVVKDAPVGVYSVSLQGFFRPGDNTVAYPKYLDGTLPKTNTICVYVNNNTDALTNIYDEKVAQGELYQTESLIGPAPYEDLDNGWWYPNDMTNAGIAFNEGLYTSKTFGIVAKQGDELRIGIKGDLDNANQWVAWDNFKMVYEGFNAEIIAPELERIVATAQANLNVTASTAAKDALKAAIDAANETLTGTDGEAMFAALSALLDANTAVLASVDLYNNLNTAVENLMEYYTTSTASAETKAAASALIDRVNAGIESGEYDEEGVAAVLLEIAEMHTKLGIPAGVPSDENPLDYTGAIINPGYEVAGANSVYGWDAASGYNFGNDDNQKGALLLEYYEKTFDISQNIVGLPAGTYEVGVSAFCRNGSVADDMAAYEADPESNTGYLYAVIGEDTITKPLSLLAAGAMETDPGFTGTATGTLNGATVYVPNDMVSSSNYFAAGLYYNSFYVKIEDGDNLRIGIKKDEQKSGDWVIMDNWKLIAYGTESGKNTGIDNVVNAGQPVNVEYYNVKGAKLNGLQKGLNIVKMTTADGRVKVSKVVVKQ